MTRYFITAWCDRTFTAQCEIEADSPEQALEMAREAIHDAPAEECDSDHPWDEWRVDTAEEEGVLLRSDRPDPLDALRAILPYAESDLESMKHHLEHGAIAEDEMAECKGAVENARLALGLVESEAELRWTPSQS